MVGYGALQAATADNDDVAVGNNALFTLTGNGNGQGNETAIGYEAGYLNNASDNVFVGYSAGYNITGVDAVAVGMFAGSGSSGNPSANTNGSTYVGYAAGEFDRSGASYNTDIGYNAGLGTSATTQTGFDNTFLGAYSGQNISSGGNNIAIGWNALATSSTGNNSLNIGNLIFASLPATTSNTTLTYPTTGTFGIGSTSPYAKFSIQSNNGDTATTLFAIGSSTQAATTTLFSVDNQGDTTMAGNLTVNGSNASIGNGSSGNALTADGGTMRVFRPGFGDMYFNANVAGLAEIYANVGAALDLGANGTNGYERITTGGLVGIGTTSPYAQLSIATPNGASGSTGTLFAIASSTASATTTLFSVSNTGNVGIGTAIPIGLLNVYGGSGNSQIEFGNTTTGNSGGYIGQLGGSGFFVVNQSSAGNLFFGTNNTTQMTITSTGNVGIGTTSPDQLLAVSGNVDIAPNFSFMQGDQTVLYATSTGFDTFGGIGAGAGIIANATSSSVTSSPFSTAFGFQALNLASTSPYNTAVGYQALKGSGTGTFSAAGSNTAVGYQALTALTTGSSNVAVGNALLSLTTGVQNVAVGNSALSNSLTTGGANTVVGYQAGIRETGFSNVALGAFSLGGSGVNATGNSNTAIGHSALAGLTSGANNTALGQGAGGGLTTGANNIVIGQAAASTTATGSNNIALGYDIALPSTNGSNQLDIGNLIFGTGINGQGPTVSTGDIGIGTSTPYSVLTVWGPDAASSTLAFNVVNSASTTVFAVFDGGNAELSGTLTQSSDQCLKTNIQSLDASDTLALIDNLNPVTFNWINPDQGTTPQLGFIAQQVQQLFPNLVSTTSATAFTPNGTLGLNYIGLISPIVSAIQALSTEMQNLISTVQGFAQSFTTNRLCVNKSDGTPVCVTGDQLAALLASGSSSGSAVASGGAGDQSPAVAQPSAAAPSSSSASVTQQTASTSTPATAPPVIQINGDNPAIIHVGDSYEDLGATITGPKADLNLDIHTFVGNTPIDQAVIDTSTTTVYHINYVVTDQNGLAATSTRTVMVEAPLASTPPPATSTTSPSATSTPPSAAATTSTPVSSPGASSSTTSSSSATTTDSSSTAATTTPQ